MTDKPSVREAAERSAAVSFTEFSAKRRGPLRRYFHAHPVAMDWVLIGIHLLFGLPNAGIDAADGELVAAAAPVGRRRGAGAGAAGTRCWCWRPLPWWTC